jgi:hypothetical protein
MLDHKAILANHDKIARLCLEAGCIMEDASAPLVSLLPYDAQAMVGRVEELAAAAEQIMALAARAQALVQIGE